MALLLCTLGAKHEGTDMQNARAEMPEYRERNEHILRCLGVSLIVEQRNFPEQMRKLVTIQYGP